jgi:hypothetical protein
MIHHLFQKWRKHQVTSYLIGMEPIINILYFSGGGGISIAMVPTIRICTSLEFSTDFTSTTGGS